MLYYYYINANTLQFLALLLLSISPLQASSSTLKTSEITNSPNYVFSLDYANSVCEDINQIPVTEQCQFIQKTCTDEKIGLFDYLSLYYCHHKKLSVIFYIVVLIVLFTTLGLTASDFLCPNLSTISKVLHMPDNLAGVTLLGLGNGAPDVFSNYTAMSIGSGSLAISELMGAALFITSVVVGSMSIVHPFQVAKKTFIRDIAFFAMCVLLVIIFISDGYLSKTECIILLSLYVGYVVFVVCWHWILSSRRINELLHKRARDVYVDDTLHEFYLEPDEENDNLFQDLPPIDALIMHSELLDSNIESNPHSRNNLKSYDELLSSVQRDRGNSRNFYSRTSLFDAIEFNSVLSKLKKQQSIKLSDDVSSYLNQPRANSEPIFNSNQGDSHPNVSASEPIYKPYSDEYNSDQTNVGTSGQESNTRNLGAPQEGVQDPEIPIRAPFIFQQRNCIGKLQSWFHRIGSNEKFVTLIETFLPEFLGFAESELFRKIYILLLSPLILLLRITTPVRRNTMNQHKILLQENGIAPLHNDIDNNRLLISTQSICSPIAISFFLFSESNIWIVSGTTLLISICSSIFIRDRFKKGNSNLDSAINIYLAFLGFASSISWISAIATEVVSVLKAVAIIFRLSDAILGLTVFAIGNSLGDLIANFTIAKMGMPRMAFGACFGGPLLSLCSFGFSGLLALNNKRGLSVISEQGYSINISSTLVVSASALIINTVFISVAVPYNNWMMNRVTGFVLLSVWFSATSVGVLIEIFSSK